MWGKNRELYRDDGASDSTVSMSSCRHTLSPFASHVVTCWKLSFGCLFGWHLHNDTWASAWVQGPLAADRLCIKALSAFYHHILVPWSSKLESESIYSLCKKQKQTNKKTLMGLTKTRKYWDFSNFHNKNIDDDTDNTSIIELWACWMLNWPLRAGR